MRCWALLAVDPADRLPHSPARLRAMTMSGTPSRPSQPSRRYAVVAPCRNEEQYMRRTLDSLAAQTVRPALLVVVDDGSTDRTPEILEEYSRKLDFLRVVRRPDRGGRSVGPGVIETFYAGLETVNLDE